MAILTERDRTAVKAELAKLGGPVKLVVFTDRARGDGDHGRDRAAGPGGRRVLGPGDRGDPQPPHRPGARGGLRDRPRAGHRRRGGPGLRDPLLRHPDGVRVHEPDRLDDRRVLGDAVPRASRRSSASPASRSASTSRSSRPPPDPTAPGPCAWRITWRSPRHGSAATAWRPTSSPTSRSATWSWPSRRPSSTTASRSRARCRRLEFVDAVLRAVDGQAPPEGVARELGPAPRRRGARRPARPRLAPWPRLTAANRGSRDGARGVRGTGGVPGAVPRRVRSSRPPLAGPRALAAGGRARGCRPRGSPTGSGGTRGRTGARRRARRPAPPRRTAP